MGFSTSSPHSKPESQRFGHDLDLPGIARVPGHRVPVGLGIMKFLLEF